MQVLVLDPVSAYHAPDSLEANGHAMYRKIFRQVRALGVWTFASQAPATRPRDHTRRVHPHPPPRLASAVSAARRPFRLPAQRAAGRGATWHGARGRSVCQIIASFRGGAG